MRIAINSFRGEAPRITPRALPDNAAQDATNARLLTGDLEAWRQFALEKVLANSSGPVKTIYNLNGVWLSWVEDVDVARGAIAGDTTFRTFLTGPEVYDRPQFTNYEMATDGAEPYPAVTRPLGVPAPIGSPTATPGVDPHPTTFAIDILDEGDQLSTKWTVSAPRGGSTFSLVTQSASVGAPPPSYLLEFDEIHNAGEEPFLHRNFGIASATVVRTNAQFNLNDGSPNIAMTVQADDDGNGACAIYSAGTLSVGQSTGWGIYSSAGIAAVAAPGVSSGVWYDIELMVISNADGTKTATASLYAGSVQIATVSGSANFSTGDNVGFSSASPDDVGGSMKTFVDNILVQASGSTGYNPTNTATNYVYTHKNDLGQESAPSFASSTVLRPDGVSITVTTPTDVPSGTDNGYGITTKAIYRAATGATGTFYRFVAEIPLAQADYVDSIPDTELGELLQSELWDLPPDDLRGVLALPNGVMAGFSKNQLCLSAQNHPHAWPVDYRLTVDTDVVAIGNIDTTVVIGTKNFIYLAIGTDPAAYSMTKLEVPQACVAKRSLAYLIGIGVVFASPDGLIAVAGNGNVQNLTGSVFTREQWQALKPESIIGVAHDDVYHFFYNNDPVPVETALWLDVFDGVIGTGLYSHTQDIQLNESIWGPTGEANEPILSGSGSAIRDIDGGSVAQSRTSFTHEGSSDLISLVSGWRYEFDLTPLQTVVEPLNLQGQSKILESENGGLLITFLPQDGITPAKIRIQAGDGFTADEYDSESGVNTIVVLMETDGFTCTVNGSSNGKVIETNVLKPIGGVEFDLGADFDTGGSVPSASIQRAAIYGTIAV